MTSPCSLHPHRRRWRRRFFAWMHAKGCPAAYERFITPHKQRLLGELRGTVLELGPGNGANLHLFPPAVRWIGIEPNPYMHPYLQREAGRLGRSIELLAASGEHIPLADASVDAVVSILVLCSVAEQEQVLAEVLRVLRPGGLFVFIEHVAAPRGTRLRRLQRLMRPLWRFCGDNCHPDRDTAAAIAAAGFAELNCADVSAPLPIASPQIIGTARK
jgi:SAM-dependent methyltransferase